MFRPYPLFIAWRYLRARRRNRFASFVSVVSVAGMALGVAALVIVLSVMNGFEREVVRHVLGMSAHAVIEDPRGIADWTTVAARLAADERLRGSAPYVRGTGMLSHRGQVTGVVIDGIEPVHEQQVSDIARYLPASALAALRADSRALLVGDGLARRLDLEAGAPVTLIVPTWSADGRALAPRYERLVVAGVFHVGMQQYDSRLGLVHLDDGRNLFATGERVSGLRLRFATPQIAPAAARELAATLGTGAEVLDWTQYHRNFFLALASQKRIMFVILVLIIAVAAFNVAANMIMVVTEKIRGIAVLRTLGATRREVVLLFVLQGLLLGLAGALLGALLGAWGAHESADVARWLEAMLGVDLINADVYFIDYLPAELRLGDVLQVATASLVLALLATLYPAFRAAGIDPARAMHYE